MKDNAITTAAGVTMPPLLYGTAWKQERTADWVEQAIKLGFRGIDTACQPKHYHEAGVGEGLARCHRHGLERKDLYLQTKFTPADGQDPARMPYDPALSIAAQVAQSFAVSLRNLQTDYLDGLVLHSAYADDRQTLEAWRAMEKLAENGGARQLGISNCYRLEVLEKLCAQARIKPAVLQNRFYAATGYDRGIREFCRQQQITYQSFWTLTANPHLLAHPVILRLAGAYGRTAEQILFRLLTQIGIQPLTGATNPIHLQQDLAIFHFALTGQECAELEQLLH